MLNYLLFVSDDQRLCIQTEDIGAISEMFNEVRFLL